MMHRFTAQKFTNRRAQHRTAIGTTRIRRWARAFELQFVALLNTTQRRRNHFAQQNRPTITKLPRPIAKLMAAVDRSVSLHTGQRAVTRKRVDHLRRVHVRVAEPERCRDLWRIRNQPGCRNRRRLNPRPERALRLPRMVTRIGVAGQRLQEAVVEVQHSLIIVLPPLPRAGEGWGEGRGEAD